MTFFRLLASKRGAIDRPLRLLLLLISTLGGVSACGLPGETTASSPLSFQLKEGAIDATGTLAAKHTCPGEPVSPGLQWHHLPPQTRSLVVIATEADAAPPLSAEPNPGTTHWVLYDLPPEPGALPGNLPSQPFLLEGGMQGKNDFDRYGYGGDCTTGGGDRLLFRLYALDQILDLPPGATAVDVRSAMAGHILAEAALEGSIRSPTP